MQDYFYGLWRHRDFMNLWIGQTISQFGSHIGAGALRFTAILFLGATPLQLSLLTAAQMLPMLLLFFFFQRLFIQGIASTGIKE